MEKSWKFQGGRGVLQTLALEWKFQGGGAPKGKTLHGMGMNISYNHTMEQHLNSQISQFLHHIHTGFDCNKRKTKGTYSCKAGPYSFVLTLSCAYGGPRISRNADGPGLQQKRNKYCIKKTLRKHNHSINCDM